jgi:hypothetical protein
MLADLPVFEILFEENVILSRHMQILAGFDSWILQFLNFDYVRYVVF